MEEFGNALRGQGADQLFVHTRIWPFFIQTRKGRCTPAAVPSIWARVSCVLFYIAARQARCTRTLTKTQWRAVHRRPSPFFPFVVCLFERPSQVNTGVGKTGGNGDQSGDNNDPTDVQNARGVCNHAYHMNALTYIANAGVRCLFSPTLPLPLTPVPFGASPTELGCWLHSSRASVRALPTTPLLFACSSAVGPFLLSFFMRFLLSLPGWCVWVGVRVLPYLSTCPLTA